VDLPEKVLMDLLLGNIERAEQFKQVNEGDSKTKKPGLLNPGFF
jgi:acyl-CoA-binding protein